MRSCPWTSRSSKCPKRKAEVDDPSRTVAGLTPEQYPDVFDRIRAGFKLEDIDSRQIDVQLAFYANNPQYLERVFGRAVPYLHHIVQEIEKRGMPLELALLPVVESAFEPYARSWATANGLWQFMPGTGERFGLKQDWWYDGRRDVLESTRAALDYLQYMHDEFFDDWLLAIAAYNCGEFRVQREVNKNRALGKGRGLLQPQPAFGNARLRAETDGHAPPRGQSRGLRHRVQPDPQRALFRQGRHRRPARSDAGGRARGHHAR